MTHLAGVWLGGDTTPENMVGAQLVFRLNQPGIGSDSNATVYDTSDVRVPINTLGQWQCDLPSTDAMRDPTSHFFTLALWWIDTLGKQTRQDFPYWRLRIPSTSQPVTIADCLTVSSLILGDEVWVGESDNPAYPFWYQPSTANLFS